MSVHNILYILHKSNVLGSIQIKLNSIFGIMSIMMKLFNLFPQIYI